MFSVTGLVLGALLPSIVLGQATPVPHTTAVSNAECPSLVQYTQTYTDCETHVNCSWVQCDLIQFFLNSTATFWIGEKCADPVMVDLRVDGSSSLSGYRGRFSVGGDGLSADTTGPNSIRIRADYGRNAGHLHYHAFTLSEDQRYRLIPKVTIPLNPRVCMCQSMQQIANAIGFPIPIPLINVETSCLPRTDCTGILCNVTLGTIGSYAVDVTIDPCGETVHFVGRDLSENGGQYDRVFRDSGSYPFSISDSLHATLMIGMVHHNYSMDLSVQLQVSSSLPVPLPTENILPSHKIILDRTNCSNITYYYKNTTDNAVSTVVPPSSTQGVQPKETTPPPPIVTTGPFGPSSCPDTFVQGGTNCGFFANCSEVQCHTSGGLRTSLSIEEKCADPVLVNLGVDQGSKKFSVGGNRLGSTEVMGNKRITVEYGRNATHLHFKARESSTMLIPEVQLPLHPHPCMCRSMDEIARSILLNTSPGTSQVTPTCSRRPNCDGISCSVSARGSIYTSQITIFPCTESVRVKIQNTNSSVLLDEVYTDKRGYPLQIPNLSAFQIKLFVDIVHYNYSMDLSMYVRHTLSDEPVVILSAHKIILDRSNCGNITFYPNNPELPTNRPPPASSSSSGSGSQPSSSGTHDQHAPSLSLVVGVPFGILLLLAVSLLVAIITVLALWRIRKRQRAFSFQRMTFNELDDDEEKD